MPELDHRVLGIDLFNQTWTLLELTDRTAEQDDAMVHTAHASAHHWRQTGTGATVTNLAASEWQVSRVYAVLGRAEPALHHARRCVELCRQPVEDWMRASSCEAMARAWAVAGNMTEARSWADRGWAAAAQLADADDRAVVLGDLATVPGLSGGPSDQPADTAR